MLATIRHQNPLFPVFSDFFGNNLFNDNEWASSPAVNVAENKEGFRIEVAAPGLNKEDFRINVEKQVLEISSEKESKKESGSKNETYYRKEFTFSSFKRTFTLPDYADTDSISASYKDGVLFVNIPKKEEAKEKPARIIAIE